MSFFDDTKNVGLLLLIIALIGIVMSVVALFLLDDYKDLDTWKKIVTLVGSVIGAVIYAILGLGIMKGQCMIQIGGLFSDVKSKFGVLVAGTAGVGISELVEGIFSIIAIIVLIGIPMLLLFIMLLLFLLSPEVKSRMGM